MTIPISLCEGCVHLTDHGRCKAFPDAIPRRFLLGDEDHIHPTPGDGGLVFEARNDEWKAIAADILEERAKPEPEGEGEAMP